MGSVAKKVPWLFGVGVGVELALWAQQRSGEIISAE
jgi:hypothetical protein